MGNTKLALMQLLLTLCVCEKVECSDTQSYRVPEFFHSTQRWAIFALQAFIIFQEQRLHRVVVHRAISLY